MELERRVSERAIVGIVAVALLLGVALYNVVPLGGGHPAEDGAALLPTTTVPATTTTVSGSSDSGGATRAGTGTLFGSGSAALAGGTTADVGAGSTVDLPGAPDTPEVPAPTCPTSVANDAYEQIVDPVSAALGKPLPRDNVRLLAEIAAGCSNESAGTPVVGLALDLSRLLPDTGVPAVDLSAVPNVSAPTIPPQVIDALGPIADPIRDGCANVALLGILASVIPGAAHIPVYGSDLAKVLTPAQTLCAQFER